jgi:hypothetical protein
MRSRVATSILLVLAFAVAACSSNRASTGPIPGMDDTRRTEQINTSGPSVPTSR